MQYTRYFYHTHPKKEGIFKTIVTIENNQETGLFSARVQLIGSEGVHKDLQFMDRKNHKKEWANFEELQSKVDGYFDTLYEEASKDTRIKVLTQKMSSDDKPSDSDFLSIKKVIEEIGGVIGDILNKTVVGIDVINSTQPPAPEKEPLEKISSDDSEDIEYKRLCKLYGKRNIDKLKKKICTKQNSNMSTKSHTE